MGTVKTKVVRRSIRLVPPLKVNDACHDLATQIAAIEDRPRSRILYRALAMYANKHYPKLRKLVDEMVQS